MTNLKALRPLALLAALLGAGCGRMAPLAPPAPLFGREAKEDAAEREAARTADRNAEAARQKAADDKAAPADPKADNAPKTRRDVKAPEQDSTTIREEPIPGSNDIVGPPPTMRPPGLR